MDREEIQRLTKEEISRRIREGVKAVIGHGQSPYLAGLSRVRIGKDVVSRIAQGLEEELCAWRGRPLELAYPYLYLDASYFKVNWGGRVEDLALLVAVGVNEEGYRGHGRSPYILLLGVEPAGGERKEAWRNLLKGLLGMWTL